MCFEINVFYVLVANYVFECLVLPIFGSSASDDRERDLTRLGPFGSADSLVSHPTISELTTKIDANTAKSASMKADVICSSREVSSLPHHSHSSLSLALSLSLSLSFDRPSYQDSPNPTHHSHATTEWHAATANAVDSDRSTINAGRYNLSIHRW